MVKAGFKLVSALRLCILQKIFLLVGIENVSNDDESS